MVATKRSLSDILIDLDAAQSVWQLADNQALFATTDKAKEQAGQQMSEADETIDFLREEFATLLRQQTGLKFRQLMQSFDSGAL